MANRKYNPVIPKLYTIFEMEENKLKVQQLQVILEHLKWQLKSSESKLARKQHNLSSAQDDLYQILGLFFVFQGVVITAVSQTSTLSCGNWYFPFMLSLLVCFAAMLAACQKLLEASKLEEQWKLEKRVSIAVRKSLESVYEKGVEVDLQMCIPRMLDSGDQRSATGNNWRSTESNFFSEWVNFSTPMNFFRKWVWSYAGAVLALILLFSAITIVSVRHLLCHTNQAAH